MNFTPHSDTGRRNDQKQSFKNRIEFDNTVYKSATEALEAYIVQFEGGRSFTTDRRRPSDLLSPAPKFYFMDSLERRLRSPPSKSPGRKVDELLEWVNVTYAKELSSKVTPYGYRTTPELPGSDEEDMNPHPAHHSYRANDDELSTGLPSPSSSVVDLDSNAGTVETEVLLSSYKRIHTSASGSYSNIEAFKSPPNPEPVKNHSGPDGSTEYPSWVSGLGKEYPSWVEDIDSSTRHRKVTQSPDKEYSSSTLSRSDTERKKSFKVFDLQTKHSYSSKRPQDPPKVKIAKSRMNGVDWNDAASTDTDMLVSQSVYGSNPVNMGGNFHKSLYQDKRVARLKKESTKKFRKSTVSPRRTKSLTCTPIKTLRVSTRNGEQFHENSKNGKSIPFISRKMRESSTESSPFSTLPARYSLPPQDERYRTPKQVGWRSASPPSNQIYTSPAVTQYSQPSDKKPEARLSPSASRQPYAGASKSPSRGSMPLKIKIPEWREDSDLESEDTDRVMRKSPTGIKMGKMYRDPSTMHPWKTMIQSSSSQNTPAKLMQSKPQYHSTPVVYAGRQPPKLGSSADWQHSNGAPHGGHRSQLRVAFSEARRFQRDRHARTVENFKLTPKAVFANSSYRSRDEKLAKSVPDTRYSKPAPRSSVRNLTHRRSKTVPDLQQIAISSATRPRHSRHSLDDEVTSLNTADTESLITRPPMPVFDVSPSLTTISDSETLVESEPETQTELGVAVRYQLSPCHFTAIQDENDKFSPTSVFASTNPHAAVREELPERFHLWKLDEDTKAPESFIKQRFTSPKSGVISSFLEDCLSVDSSDPKLAKRGSTSSAARLSGKEAAPGPVEALKQMLFTMQDMAHHETLDNGHLYKNMDSKSREVHVKDPTESDDQSERDLDIIRGEVSLQRAYHHLERLKRLVGREDDRSSMSSANL